MILRFLAAAALAIVVSELLFQVLPVWLAMPLALLMGILFGQVLSHRSRQS